MTLASIAALLAATNVPQNPWPFIVVGYVIMVAALGAYAWRTVRRGRRLARQLPPDERRWM